MNGTEQNFFLSSGNSKGARLYTSLIGAIAYNQSVLYVYQSFVTLFRVMVINLEHFLSLCQNEHNTDSGCVVFFYLCTFPALAPELVSV